MTAVYRQAIGLACGVVAALIWAGGAVVTRHLVTTKFAAIDLVLLRYVGSFAIAIGALALWYEHCRPNINWHRLVMLVMLVLLAGPPYQFLVMAGYEHATAGAGTLLISGLLPVFSLALAVAFGGTLPAIGPVIGAMLAASGIGLFAVAGGEAIAFSHVGFAIFAIAAILWAVLNMLVRVWQVSPWRLTITLAVWSPVFLPLYVLYRPSMVSDLISRDGLIQLVYHGWLVAFVATMLFFGRAILWGYERIGAAGAFPGFSAVLGAVLLGEVVTGLQMVAIALTTMGVALVAYLGIEPRSGTSSRTGRLK